MEAAPQLPQGQNKPNGTATPSAPDALIEGHDAAYWHARFKVTDGMIKRNKDEHAGLVEAKDAEIAELRGKVASTPATIDLKAYYTPEQIDKYGEDFLTAQVVVQQKMLREGVQNALKPLQEEQAKAKQAKAGERKEMFLSDLTAKVPTWKQIDNDPRWHAWLAATDEDGAVRQDMLDFHAGRQNAAAVAKMFGAFLKQSGAVDAGKPQAMPEGGAPADGGGSGQAADDRIANFPLTRVAVKEFFKRRSLDAGKAPERRYYSDAQAVAIEKRINDAYEQGLIR